MNLIISYTHVGMICRVCAVCRMGRRINIKSNTIHLLLVRPHDAMPCCTQTIVSTEYTTLIRNHDNINIYFILYFCEKFSYFPPIVNADATVLGECVCFISPFPFHSPGPWNIWIISFTFTARCRLSLYDSRVHMIRSDVIRKPTFMACWIRRGAHTTQHLSIVNRQHRPLMMAMTTTTTFANANATQTHTKCDTEKKAETKQQAKPLRVHP